MQDISTQLDKIQKQEELRGSAKWFKFVEIGDQIEGALVTSFEAISNLGQHQVIYVLKNAEGLFNVAFSKKSQVIHRELESAKIGQVARFTFLDKQPHKVKGYHPINIIRVFTRADLLDEGTRQDIEEYGFEFGAPLAHTGLPETAETQGDESAEPVVVSDNAKPLGSLTSTDS